MKNKNYEMIIIFESVEDGKMKVLKRYYDDFNSAYDYYRSFLRELDNVKQVIIYKVVTQEIIKIINI